MGGDSHEPDFQRLFEASPGLLLVLLPDAPRFTIVAASDAYLTATMRTRHQVLRRGLEQLLDNAINYGRGRPITLNAAMTTGGAGGSDQLSIQVRDEGIGIDVDDQQRIFQRFERAVSPTNYGGLGVGLYVVKRVAEAMGGSVSVSSQLGAGSTFTLRLPVDARSSLAAAISP